MWPSEVINIVRRSALYPGKRGEQQDGIKGTAEARGNNAGTQSSDERGVRSGRLAEHASVGCGDGGMWPTGMRHGHTRHTRAPRQVRREQFVGIIIVAMISVI